MKLIPNQKLALINLALFTLFAGLSFQARTSATASEKAVIKIQLDQPGNQITGPQVGIFFEDINFGADGGLYAELVKNRSFEFPTALMGWNKSASIQGEWQVAKREDAQTNNLHFLQLSKVAAGFAITNEGFRGIGIKQGSEYALSLLAQRPAGSPINLKAELVSQQGQVIATGQLRGIAGDWKSYRANLRAIATDTKANLRLTVEGSGDVSLDMISLFPKATWKGRPNGLRADLVQLLAGLKPGFVRFPGGCIVEGRELETRYQWKTTIGEVAERKLIVNRWNTEFKHRPTPDYYQSFGVGFFEYFQLCEDIGAEPLPILNCGMACQFNTKELAPLNQLDPYVQDALDLIEFANGSIVSQWGSMRAAMGHPAPFNLKMIGVGNEQWGPDYIPRYEIFAQAIKAKHPSIKLVSSAGPSAAGTEFNFLWEKLSGLRADLIDEHYYMKPDWFLKNAGRYDNYDRSGPHVFAGEYAAQSSGTARPDNRNNWECALAEAAFMTGLDRNADLVELSSYAPLFGHTDAWQWTPNLIWFDNLRSFGTPNYYVQKLFSTQRGDTIYPLTINGAVPYAQQGLYASATKNTATNELILKIVNTGAAAQTAQFELAGVSKVGKQGKALVLGSPDLKAENTLDKPKAITPTEFAFTPNSPTFAYQLPAQSLVVLRIPLSR